MRSSFGNDIKLLWSLEHTLWWNEWEWSRRCLEKANMQKSSLSTWKRGLKWAFQKLLDFYRKTHTHVHLLAHINAYANPLRDVWYCHFLNFHEFPSHFPLLYVLVLHSTVTARDHSAVTVFCFPRSFLDTLYIAQKLNDGWCDTMQTQLWITSLTISFKSFSNESC